jgi:hypothetical protein
VSGYCSLHAFSVYIKRVELKSGNLEILSAPI